LRSALEERRDLLRRHPDRPGLALADPSRCLALTVSSRSAPHHRLTRVVAGDPRIARHRPLQLGLAQPVRADLFGSR
jgi:hypothetical protein